MQFLCWELKYVTCNQHRIINSYTTKTQIMFWLQILVSIPQRLNKHIIVFAAWSVITIQRTNSSPPQLPLLFSIMKYVPTPNIPDNQNNYSDTDSKKAEDYTVDSNVQNFENEDINSYLSYNTNSEISKDYFDSSIENDDLSGSCSDVS